MKITLVMLSILGASLIGIAQDKNFDLSKYKFPDYKRHELELDISSNGSGYSRKVENPDYLINGSSADYLSSSYNSLSNAGLSYTYNFLSRKRIDYLYSSFSGNYNYSSSRGINSKLKDYGLSYDLSLNGSRMLYLTEDKFFVEGLANMRFNQNNSKSKAEGQLKSKDRYTDMDFSVGAGIGTGRMEMVSDLWQAHFILEKLRKEKLLSKELTNENVYEFAYLSSSLKNKRFFDSRLRKIDELQSLDSLLHKQGLVNESDIGYFTLLNDYWSYGNFPQRQSGRVLKFWISPEYAKAYNNDAPKSYNPHKTSLISNVSFDCRKQLNLYWERRVSISLSYEAVLDKSGIYYTSYQKNNLNPNLNFGFGFFPDSRTSISGYLGYSGRNQFISNTTVVMPKEWINSIFFSFNGYYYISPQLQLTGSFRLSYNDKSYQSTDNFYSQYNLGLRYAIF
jgi:hypothetical protein